MTSFLTIRQCVPLKRLVILFEERQKDHES
jgi:hypothetical protein